MPFSLEVSPDRTPAECSKLAVTMLVNLQEAAVCVAAVDRHATAFSMQMQVLKVVSAKLPTTLVTERQI